jgi:hypothetical protein
MSKAEDNGKESEEPDYDEDKDQLEEKQEEETGEQEIKNQVFELVNRCLCHIKIFRCLS